MGINQFFQIELPGKSKPLGSLAREMTLVKLKNIRVSVDTPNMIYSAILAMQHIDALSDADGNTTAHINTIWAKALQLDSAGISQIWVFDSPKPNPLKQAEQARRRERAYNSTDPKVQFRMNETHVNDIKTLLGLMGITYIEAPEGIEAEQYGAWMSKGPVASARFCQYMISADSDVLAFGGNLIRPYQKPSATGKSKRLVYQVFELEDMLTETNLDYEQFLKLCVSMGTDFCDKTPGIGVKTAITKARSKTMQINPQQQSVIDYYKSRPLANTSDATFNTYDLEGLVKFLVGRKFNEERVREKMSKYPKVMN